MKLDLFALGKAVLALRPGFGPEGSGPAPSPAKLPSSDLQEVARLDNDAVLARLDTSLDGLLAREAEERTVAALAAKGRRTILLRSEDGDISQLIAALRAAGDLLAPSV